MASDGVPAGKVWAKLERDASGRVVRWHSLVAHSADVAACLLALLDSRVLRTRLARLGGWSALTQVHCLRLAALAGLHDIGKCNRGFQNKALAKPPFVAGHVQPLLDAFGSTQGIAIAKAIGLDEMSAWFANDDELQRWLIGTFSHHGRPQIPGYARSPEIWSARAPSDPIASVSEVARLVKGWLPAAWATGAEAFPGEPGLLHAFNGLLTLADWIASDTRFFPLAADESDFERFESSLQRARAILISIGVDVASFAARISKESDPFALISGYDANEMQESVAALPSHPSGSLTIIESETGSGKTEAALAHFAKLARAGLVDGMYFALPTRTAATQIYQRVIGAVQRLFAGCEGSPGVVLAVPGYLTVDGTKGYRLPEFQVRWSDDPNDRLRERGWAAEQPKRFLASGVAVGTVDQALFSVLQVSHAHLRASSLLRQLLVVDEVHASDAYMARLLREVVRRQVQSGGHVLLMSATLGSIARDRLLAEAGYLRRTPLRVAVDAAYPVVAHCDVTRGVLTERPFASAQHRSVQVEVVPLISEPSSIAALAMDAARLGARVLIVRNTVADCVATHIALETLAIRENTVDLIFSCHGIPAPHHSRYAREDRIELDGEVQARFGRASPGTPCVLVATQTVEQSLDIDADVLISDLCPMDVLLQRMGRVHRHSERLRVAGFEVARAIVLVPEARDMTSMISKGRARGRNGLGTVYEYLTILEATWRLLEMEKVLEIPSMSRKLVEYATHPEALVIIERELGDAWLEHGRYVQGIWLGSQRIASLNILDWTLPYPAMPGDALFPSGALAHDIATRLGQEDRLVNYPRSREGVFGTRIHSQTIPARFALGVPADAEVEDIEDMPGGFSFRLGERRFAYDRLGLRVVAKSDEGESTQ